MSQKKTMVYNLIDRAVKLSDKKYHQKNIDNVKNLLRKNSYPIVFIEKYVALRLRKIKSSENHTINNMNNKKQYKKCVVLPYIKGTYERLSSCFKNYYIDTVPKSSKNLSVIIIKVKIRPKKF